MIAGAGTNNTWTMWDIRRGQRSPLPRPLGSRGTGAELPTVDSVALTSTNRTTDSHILVYNRVPKCASTSIQNMLKKLARKNKFTLDLGAWNNGNTDAK